MTQAPQDDSGDRDEQEEPVVVTDNRKVDPETGQARTPDSAGEAEAGAGAAGLSEDGAVDENEIRVAELTGDLQRLQAEYANYRKREQRERQVAIDLAKASVIGELLDLLDDLDRAREHGDLESGPLKAIGDKLVGRLQGLGLESFGEVGDLFDPELHEAVQHSGDGAAPVLDTVLRRGYRVRDRVLRSAMVVVGDGPGDDTSSGAAPEATTDSGAHETASEATVDSTADSTAAPGSGEDPAE